MTAIHYVPFSLLTSCHDDEVLFIKAYSLERTTIQQLEGDAQAIQPDEVLVTARDTEGTESGSGADASDEKSEGQVQSLQREPGKPCGEQEHTAHDVIDEKKRNDESEKV